MEATIKAVCIMQMEEALSAAIASLTDGEAAVAVRMVKDISDGADNLIGQERWELSVMVTVQRKVP